MKLMVQYSLEHNSNDGSWRVHSVADQGACTSTLQCASEAEARFLHQFLCNAGESFKLKETQAGEEIKLRYRVVDIGMIEGHKISVVRGATFEEAENFIVNYNASSGVPRTSLMIEPELLAWCTQIRGDLF
jgi:hypothetical protein